MAPPHACPDAFRLSPSFRYVLASLVAFSLAWSLSGCGTMPPVNPPGNGDDGDGAAPQRADCVGCHTNETMLKSLAREEPAPVEDSGEG